MNQIKPTLKDCNVLPSDYAGYGGTIERWKDDRHVYANCSAGCRYFAPLFNAENDGDWDFDFGVCLSPTAPRHGLLTFEHQAGFECFETKVIG